MECFRIHTKVQNLEFKTRAVRAYKPDPNKTDVTVEREDIGWFVCFENSYESLFVGKEKPANLDPGTEVDIILVPVIK